MPRTRSRQRLVGPASAGVLVAASLAGLAALFLRAGDPRRELARSSPDFLAVAYLQAMAARRPEDATTRCQLARTQLALGRTQDAERTLAPLLERGQTGEPALLAVDTAAAAWRAAPSGSAERAAAEAKALRRLERLVEREPEPARLAHLANVAREMGRPDLAADACARAYDRSRNPKEAMAAGLQALDAFLAAGRAAEGLRLADRLVERFPGDPEVLQRAEAIALGQNDPEHARRFGERLMAIGAADAVSLARQLDLELAAGDLAGALRAAEQLADHAPTDAGSQLTAAKVATWAGQPEAALRHWKWLARHGSAPGSLDRALELARAVGDPAAVAELLTLRSRGRPLSPASLAEMAGALEKSGPPGKAVAAIEAYARRHSGSRYAWEELAAAQERNRDLAAAIVTRGEMARRFGRGLKASLHLARLRWALGQAGAALAELRRWSDSAGQDEADYWELLAELAWDQEADDLARRAYRALWNGGRIDAAGAERLLLLSRDAGRRGDAIRYGREGWNRIRQPRLLLLAMDEAARAGRWRDLERMTAEAASDPNAFAGYPTYWLLRARVEEHSGRLLEAIEAYRRALAADPRSAAARSGVIWLLAGSHRREALSRCLAAWERDAWKDPALWRAYAAGLEELGRRREALAFYQRQALADPGDAGAVKRLAAALQRAGDPAAAARLDVYLAESQVHAPVRAALASTSSTTAEPGLGSSSGAGQEALDALRGWSGRFRSSAAAIRAEVAVESIGPVVFQQERAAARSEALGPEVEARVALTGFDSRDPSLRLPGEETEVLARGSFPALGGQNEVAAGASLRSDGTLPRASLVHARDLGSSIQARLEAALAEPADESVALRVEAARTRLGGAVGLADGPLYGRGGLDWKWWAARAGGALGSGGVATMEVGWLERVDDVDTRIWLQGGYQRNFPASGPTADVLAAFAPGAPGFLPRELAMAGLGAGASRWPVGPARLLADAWVGWIWPPARPAFRVHLGVSIVPFDGSELSLSGVAANDRWASGGNYGVSLALTHRFSR